MIDLKVIINRKDIANIINNSAKMTKYVNDMVNGVLDEMNKILTFKFIKCHCLYYAK